MKITSWVENAGFKLFSKKARHYESGSVCNVLISLIRQHNGLLLFLRATLLCSLDKFSVKFSFSLHILHLYWPWALSKHYVREMLKCFTKSVQSHLQPSSKHHVIHLYIRGIIWWFMDMYLYICTYIYICIIVVHLYVCT